MNYYIKTTDEAELWSALEAADLAYQDEGEWVFTGMALDIIGVIYKPTGQMLTDPDGGAYPEMAPIDGYHANLIADASVEGLPIIEAPDTPYRIWAGDTL